MAEAPISLYLDLEPGETADLEVVARAALAFASAVRETAFIFDPSIKVRVELESGTEGSLSLNTIIKTLRERAAERPILAAIIMATLGWFGNYTATEIADALRGPDSVNLTDEQVQELVDKVVAAVDGRVAAPQVQQVYRELERDPAIRGVGATTSKGDVPREIIPREEFAIRSESRLLPMPEDGKRRPRVEKVRVIIVSPVLKVSNHVWRFQSAEGEFNARIKDMVFLGRLVAGDITLPMKGGVGLDVVLETIEEFQSGVWVPVERSILEVLGRHDPIESGDLFGA